jgi:hypothetical protein
MALHCDTPSMLQSLYMTSATSADYGTQEGNTHSDLLPYDSVKDHSECPVGTALVIARAGQPNGETRDMLTTPLISSRLLHSLIDSIPL